MIENITKIYYQNEKMGKVILTLVILKLKKDKFYLHKSPIFFFFEDVDIEKVLVPYKISSDKKIYWLFV